MGGSVFPVYASTNQSCDIPTVQVTPPTVYSSPSSPSGSLYTANYQGAAASSIPSVVPMSVHAYPSPYQSTSNPSPSPAMGIAPFSSQTSPFPNPPSVCDSRGASTDRGIAPMVNSYPQSVPRFGNPVPVEVLKNQIRQKIHYDQIPDFDKLEFGITDTQNSQNASQLSTVCQTNTPLNNIIPSFASSPPSPPASPCSSSWRTADWSHRYCSRCSSPGCGNADPPC